jgi:hypothetical protein
MKDRNRKSITFIGIGDYHYVSYPSVLLFLVSQVFGGVIDFAAKGKKINAATFATAFSCVPIS